MRCTPSAATSTTWPPEGRTGCSWSRETSPRCPHPEDSQFAGHGSTQPRCRVAGWLSLLSAWSGSWLRASAGGVGGPVQGGRLLAQGGERGRGGAARDVGCGGQFGNGGQTAVETGV